MLMAKQTEPGCLAYPPEEKQEERSGVESSKGRRFATSTGFGKSVFVSAMKMSSIAGPLMNVKSQNKWMILRLTCSAPWYILLALLSATTVSPAPAFSQGTLEQRIACTPDVPRLCSAFIPNADEITTCLREKNAELSDARRTAFEAAMTQLPGASLANAPQDKDR